MRAVLTAATAALLLAGLTACTGDPVPEPAATPSVAAPAATTAAPASPPACDARTSWRPSRGLEIPATGRLREISDRGRLILGTSQDTLLFASRDPFTGRIEGFDVDMGRQIAKAIFGDENRLEVRVVPRAKRIEAVTSGQVDLVINTMTTNCTRWEQVDFSTVYFEAGQRVLVGKDSAVERIEDLGGRTVCAAEGSTSLGNIGKVAVDPKPVAVGRADFGACLVAFQRGEVEAISTDDTILAGLAAQDPYAKVVGVPFTEEPYAIAIDKKNRDLTEFVNAVLERMRADGTWKAVHDRWLGASGPAPQPPAARYR
ncbi:glutamate ABC transporter substrate-binding protein [Actinoplanes sp. NEAU-A12]|uniref:Glutamate ABC transporter substrate-binding protein n=1 Tax=Actinoplanes sandaracinus TaxID=3045177 RepID=A0ABT6WK53_9ACTN|nr:glutamate ABC transporter substrate-binding protein [Actinoplanes sandaracinus]MDI6100101.1 glutamate ABC transporter substrate-binding protein [Actinoplanes sandaracinus]